MLWFKEMSQKSIPPARTMPPPPPLSSMVRYAPLFNYIELMSGKTLSDDDKKTIVVIASAGAASAWSPK